MYKNHKCCPILNTIRGELNSIRVHFSLSHQCSVMGKLFIFMLSALILPFTTVQGQPPEKNGIDGSSLNAVDPNSNIFRARERANCKIDFRTLDGTCTGIGLPVRHLWGSTNRPHFSYFGKSSTRPTGEGLKSPRLVSNVLCQQSQSTFDERKLSEMAAFFGQFVDHTVVATPTNKSEPMFIEVPSDDPTLPYQKLIFFRSVRVRVRAGSSAERPQNTLPSAIDLASVYGPSETRNKALRAFKDGLLKTSSGDLMPFNTNRLNNAPTSGKQLFLAGDHRANEHPVLTSLHTIFMREHNSIARELKENFPNWNDEELYQNARHINIAQMQKIVFEEWLPAITGRTLPPYRGFKSNVDPSISVIFSTAAFRVGHTMIGNQLNRRGPGNKLQTPVSFQKMLFPGSGSFKIKGLESFVRGALFNRAQKIDLKVSTGLRDFLFKTTRGEDGVDLIALNLQRCRDHACPTYNEVRKKFLGRKARSFADITKDGDVQSKLEFLYGSVDKVELWIGLVAEDHIPRSSMGPTMLKIWMREFSRLRDGDQFYFRTNGYFSRDVLHRIGRARAVLQGAKTTFRDIILRNTNIATSELPDQMFFAN